MSLRSYLVACTLIGIACARPASPQEAGDAPRPSTVAERIQRLRAIRSPQPAIRVHAVLIGDTLDKELGAGATADLARIRKILTDSFTEQECAVKVLEGDAARKRKLFETIDGLKVAEGREAVLVYVSSHGLADPKNRHLLDLPGEDVSRDELAERIRRKNPQLGVLLTDACANRADLELRGLLALQNWSSAKKFIDRLKQREPLPTNRQTVRRLLLEHQGMVDINSCLPKQEASSDPRQGGFFTIAFALACCHDQEAMAPPPHRGRLPKTLEGKAEGKDYRVTLHKVDRDGNGFVGWDEFMAFLVNNYLWVFYGSANQSPWIIRLN